jgi:predicted transcriptional regulator
VNALNLLELLNLPITVSAISKQANISFNTAKKYKKIIEEKEAHRNKQNFNNQKVS